MDWVWLGYSLSELDRYSGNIGMGEVTMRWRFWGMLGAMVCLGQEVSAQNTSPNVAPALGVVKWDRTVTIDAKEPRPANPQTNLPVVAPSNELPPADFAGAKDRNELFDPTGPLEQGQIWGGLDYLLWWMTPNAISGPELVTRGNWNDSAPGAVGQTNTVIVGPAPNINYGGFSGGKLTLGGWLDFDQSIGIEFTGILTEQRSWGAYYEGATLPANQIFTNPTNALLPYQGSNAIGQWSTASTLKQAGIVLPPINNYMLDSNLRMWSGDISGVANWGRTATQSLDVLFGFRQMQVQEGLSLKGQSAYYDSPNAQYVTQSGVDAIASTNGFYGAQLGAKISEQFGNLKLDVVTKFAMGATVQNINFTGSNTVTTLGGATTTPGYVYTQKSNLGLHNATRFAVLPDIMVKLGLPITENMHMGVGYSFMYLSSVARTGNQLDPYINAAANPAHPIANMGNDGIWAQGVMFSAEWKY